MEKYYVNENAQFNGNHEVHKEGCRYLELVVNKFYLGEFDNCEDAVEKAGNYYMNVDGCYFCCNNCHEK